MGIAREKLWRRENTERRGNGKQGTAFSPLRTANGGAFTEQWHLQSNRNPPLCAYVSPVQLVQFWFVFVFLPTTTLKRKYCFHTGKPFSTSV